MKNKKPIPEKYRKAIQESREYLANKKELSRELKNVLKTNRK